MPQPIADPILISVRKALDAMYGARIERVMLFGSRARNDATEDSDYDIAVFLHDMEDRWADVSRLAELNFNFINDAGVFLDIKPYRSGSIVERTPIMHEIRLDGRDF